VATPDVASWAVPAALIATAAGVWWLGDRYPSLMPFWAPWDFSPPVFLTIVFALWWYARGLLLTPAEARPSTTRRVLFLAGVIAIYAVLQTRFEYLSQHMFFLHRVQHLVMHHLGPFLIAMAWPGQTLWRGMPAALRRMIRHPLILRGLSILQRPVLAAVLFVGLIFFWLIPPIHFFAMLSVGGYALMNWSMVLDGLLFWCLVMDPRPSPPASLSMVGRLVLVLVIQMPQIAGGAVIAFSGIDLYSYYALCGRIYAGIDAAMDQQIGGFIIIFPAAMMSVLAALIIVNRMWHQQAAEHAVSMPAYRAG
jgi:putative membrane protein